MKQIASIVFIFVHSCACMAAVTVSPSHPGFVVTCVPGSNGEEITITRTAAMGGTTFIVSTDNPADVVDFIRVQNTGGFYPYRIQVQIAPPFGTSPALARVNEVKSLDSTRLGVFWLRTSGDVGSVTNVEYLHHALIGGDVTGNFDIAEELGTQNEVFGDFLGELAAGGPVEHLTIRGSFGNPSGTAKFMRVYGEIRDLTIGEVLNGAVIEARDTSSNLTSIQTLTIDDQWGASGDMDGEIIADDVEVLTTGGIPLIDIKGDLNGVIDLASAFDARMLIGGSFGADAEINLPSNGLVGQIVFNSANGSGTWAGDLTIGATTYPEEYSALPAAIGGGAAGLAPFDLHEDDSTPVQNGFVANGEIDIADPELNCEKIDFEPEIELYGKVALSGDIDDRVNVEISSGGSWVTAGFDLETTIGI